MWLKRVEIGGFKSFADQTALEFSPGICVVVGPNGCGKSNVVEAICWAMGEQGLRPLRAKCSEDLIFAGTRDLPGAPSCEVTLVFDNQQGGASAEFNQYAEIAVTRRLSRTGESEYLLNKTRCRLKDITEFFLGTGLGKQAYSIIEQGEVERMLAAKPEEIRAMIEEAAAIGTYRFRRDEAARKIALTRENLTRIRDILAELERQLNSLSRQAKKAERYHRYRDEIKTTELDIFAWRGLVLNDKLKKIETELQEKTAQLEQTRNDLARLELEQENQRTEQELANAELGREQRTQDQFKSRLENLEAEAGSLSSREQAEQASLERRSSEQVQLEARKRELEQELAAKSKQKEELEIELSSLLADLEIKAQELEARSEESKKRKILFNTIWDEARKLEQELARLGEKEKSMVWQETRLREELEQTSKRLLELEPIISGDRQRSFDFNQNLHQLRKSLSELEQKFADSQQGQEKLRELIAKKSGRLQELKNQYQSVSAKWESLKEMLEKLEGFDRGVKYILEKNRASTDHQGVHGLVADFIETQPGYELAVEAILGERIQGVVVDSPAQGLQAISALTSESAGRGTFIPLALRALESAGIPEHIRAAGARPLSELVQVRPGFEAVANYLIGQSVLVNDLNQAVELWNQNGFKGAFVTRDGAVLDPHGILSGGSKDQTGFLSKKRQLKELEDERALLKTRLDQEEGELNFLSRQALEQEKDLEQARNRKHNLQLEVLNQEKDLASATEELNQKTESLGKLKERSLELGDQVGKMSREQAEVARRKTEIVSQLERMKNENDTLKVEMESKELELARLEEERAQFRADQAGLKEKILAVEEARQRFAKSLEEMAARSEQLHAELAAGETGLVGIRDRRVQLSAEKDGLLAALEAQAAKLSELEQKKRTLDQNVLELQGRLKETNRSTQERQSELSQLSLDFERAKLDLDHQKQLLNEIYAEDLDQVAERLKPTIDLAGFQLEPKQAQVEELRRLILRMGEVNPTALEEYKEVEARFSFLNNQESDLISALTNLEATISRMNQEYRKQFKTSFEEVNIIFQELFPKLFGGGKGMLVLTDENNLLESGIEIVAQPPGKKLQSLSLLSGGEKSLAALALIFALYLNRPSPFCLLDEVDAALDEINVDRFNQLLRNVSEKSQILLVTHNKRTMELADLLYGVTMEKPGVSTVVSVKLEEKNG